MVGWPCWTGIRVPDLQRHPRSPRSHRGSQGDWAMMRLIEWLMVALLAVMVLSLAVGLIKL